MSRVATTSSAVHVQLGKNDGWWVGAWHPSAKHVDCTRFGPAGLTDNGTVHSLSEDASICMHPQGWCAMCFHPIAA